MKISKITFLLFFLFSFFATTAQDDLLNQLDAEKSAVKEIETAAFKGLQICTMQSTKLASKGEWYFLVAHRFGDLTEGFDNFFGFDNANSKIGGIYGVTEWLSLGASRHTYKKTYELTAKYKLANQETSGFPLTIVGYNTMDINSEKKDATMPGLKFNHRLAYSTQLLISRKFSDSFSLELTPIYVYKNLYDGFDDQKSTLLLGTGARYKIAKRLSVNLEYAARLNLPEESVSMYQNPLTIGLDIETGGHVFQLVFSNSQPMNDVAVYTNALGDWNGGSIYFGFNMYRVF
jgi:opacity protein-like surface antigen